MESKTDKTPDVSEGVLPVLGQSLTTIDDNESGSGEVRPSTARMVNNYGFEYQNWADKNEQHTAPPPPNRNNSPFNMPKYRPKTRLYH